MQGKFSLLVLHVSSGYRALDLGIPLTGAADELHSPDMLRNERG